MNDRTPIIYTIILGIIDAFSGIMLMMHPTLMLKLLLVTDAPIEPIYLRWVGAFVMGIGFTYLYPFILERRRECLRRLMVVWEVTAIMRFGTAGFILSAVGLHMLHPTWMGIFVANAGLAFYQVWMLRQGTFGWPDGDDS